MLFPSSVSDKTPYSEGLLVPVLFLSYSVHSIGYSQHPMTTQ